MLKSGNEIINILWTGGLDSTFRICELSRFPVTVQPYYIVEERASEKCERKAMQKIIELLKKKPTTRFTLLPIKYIDWKSFLDDAEISVAYESLRER